MFGIHYVVGPGNDQPIDKETSGAEEIGTAIAAARQKIKNTNIAIPFDPANPHPTGFLVFDASGEKLLHRDIWVDAVPRGPHGGKLEDVVALIDARSAKMSGETLVG